MRPLLLFLTPVAAALFLVGCAHNDHLRETIQRDHPDCFVMEDLSIECPNPFDQNAGFGTEVKNQKIKRKKK